MRKLLPLAALSALLLACSSEPSKPSEAMTSGDVMMPGNATTSSSGPDSTPSQPMMTDEEYRKQAVQGMHDALLADIKAMGAAALELQSAAPTPPDRGWDPKLDAVAIAAMRDAWVRARTAYEHIEGALAPLFPTIDKSIDARYDDFMADLESKGGDSDLFDGAGVTGMHAIERIIYADVTPKRVIDFEKALPNYKPAAFPANAQEAADFKSKLCAKFIADAKLLNDQWTPANIDVAIAFQGLISLVEEQREKVNKASSNEEESRYSQRTMADLRDNLVGTKVAYALFQPWILSKSSPNDLSKDGKAIDAKILAGLEKIDSAYQKITGAAIPEPPGTWSAENPSAADLMTPFGQLYSVVHDAVDPKIPDSVVSQMGSAAGALGLDKLPGAQ
jgi:iron uptake system component EfeO